MRLKRLLHVLGAVCLAVVIGLTPLMAGCAGGDNEAKTLKVGFILPYTGAAAEKGRPMGDAQLDCIKYVNEELGGVAGHQIEVIWRDSEYDAAKVPIIVNEFIDQGVLLFTTASSKEMTAAMEGANRVELPGFSTFGAPSLTHPPKHIYAQTPDYGDDWAAFSKYYMDNVWQGGGKPRMALHLLNNATGYGARDAAKALADELGIEIVAIEEHAATTTSEIESLTRIKALSPDVLYISSTPQPTSIIVKDALNLDMYPGMTIALGHAGMTSKFVELAGAAAEGVYGVYPTVGWEDSVPAMAKMTEYCQELHPEDYGNMDYIGSWAASLIVVEALKLAVEEVGIENITPQAVEKYGLQKLNNYDVGGLHGPVTYVAGDNRLAKSVRVFQVEGGNILPVSEWVEAPLIRYEDFDWFGK